MGKKKILTLLMCGIAIVSGLTACSSNGKTQGEDKEQVMEKDLRRIYKIKILEKYVNHSRFGESCGSKDGYYSIHSNEDGMMNIMYVDYKAKKRIYLCDKSECKHDNEKCTSFIDFKYGAMEKTILCDDKYLYLITSEYNNENGVSTYISYPGQEKEDEPTTIYRMDLDGSNEKRY